MISRNDGSLIPLIILKAENLTKSFGGILVLSELTFEVYRGEVLGIIGPNGAGKTTLLNVLTGIYRLDKGKILLDNHNITNLPSHKIARMGVLKTYQTPSPFWNMTVLENLLVTSTSCQKVKLESSIEHCIEILKMLSLDKFKHDSVKNLTPFQLRKLEIARSIACKPKLLLLDEPAAGVRGTEVEEILNVINKIRSMGVTIILVEHRMDVVVNVVDRIIVLHHGKKLYEGKPKEVLSAKVVIDTYLGEAIP